METFEEFKARKISNGAGMSKSSEAFFRNLYYDEYGFWPTDADNSGFGDLGAAFATNILRFVGFAVISAIILYFVFSIGGELKPIIMDTAPKNGVANSGPESLIVEHECEYVSLVKTYRCSVDLLDNWQDPKGKYIQHFSCGLVNEANVYVTPVQQYTVSQWINRHNKMYDIPFVLRMTADAKQVSLNCEYTYR